MNFSHLRYLRAALVGTYRFAYVRLFGMDIHRTAQFSLSVKFDKTNPRGVHVGAHSYIAFDVALLTHDLTRGVRRHTIIGKNCFVGARSILMPGVTVGDGSIVGAGSVVTTDVPPGAIAAGNPARVIKTGISVGPYGRFPNADEIQRLESVKYGLD